MLIKLWTHFRWMPTSNKVFNVFVKFVYFIGSEDVIEDFYDEVKRLSKKEVIDRYVDLQKKLATN